MHTYTLFQWMMLFYVYGFLGWCLESLYVSFLQKKWVNRGFLRAPILPIYGSGALCILWVCLPVKANFLAVFVLGIIFPTILEYITGWAMELLFKMRYWDYSDKKYNINGYICLESTIEWGFLSTFLVHVIHPPVGQFVVNQPRAALIAVVVVITVVFAADFVVSFRAAFNLSRILEETEHLRAQLESAYVQLDLARADARDKLLEIGQDAKDGYRRQQQMLEMRVSKLRIEMAGHLARQNKYLYRAMLRAHPTAKSNRFAQSLNQLREMADKRKDHKK